MLFCFNYHIHFFFSKLNLRVGWDGNKIVKSTISHGSKEIKNRTVSMCIASTGRRWPDLLRELSLV